MVGRALGHDFDSSEANSRKRYLALGLGMNAERAIRKRYETVGAKDEVARQWYVVDARGQTLGRLSTEIANRLRGKHKALFTPHVDTGDYVIVINADKVKVTAEKRRTRCTTITRVFLVASNPSLLRSSRTRRQSESLSRR